MSYRPTTELEAVNIMLGTIGEAPASSLEAPERLDVADAIRVLDEVSRAVQKRGFDFNTDEDYTLVADEDGFFIVPLDALSIDPHDPTIKAVTRGNPAKLWDKKEHTFVWTKDSLKVDIVRYFPFDELPEDVRYYIAIRAARVFQRRNMGDGEVEAFTEAEEFQAQVAMEQAHADTRESSLLNDPHIYVSRRYRREY